MMTAKLFLLVPFSLLLVAATRLDSLDKVVVTVNGEPIMERQVLEEIDIRINAQAAQDRQRDLIYDESSRKDTRAYLRDDVLHMMIERLLIADQLKMDQIAITDSDVQQRFAKEAADRHQTLVEAKASIAEEGQTVQSVTEGLRQTMGVEMLFKAHASDQKEMTETEAREFYNANPNYFAQPELRRVSRILFRVAPGADQPARDAAHKKAEEAMKRMNAGDDFAKLARQFSEDETTKSRGGDRGWSPRGWIASADADPFGNAAFAMKNIGDLSGIVSTQDGWDIITLTGLKPAHLPPFEEVESQIRRDFLYRKIGDFWNVYGSDLWKKAKIDWSSEEIARQAEKEKQQREVEQKMAAETAQQKQQQTP